MKILSAVSSFIIGLLGIAGGIVTIDGDAGYVISSIGLLLSTFCIPLGAAFLIFGRDDTRQTIFSAWRLAFGRKSFKTNEWMGSIVHLAIRLTYLTGWLVALLGMLTAFIQADGWQGQTLHLVMSAEALAFAYLLVELVLRPLQLRLPVNHYERIVIRIKSYDQPE